MAKANAIEAEYFGIFTSIVKDLNLSVEEYVGFTLAAFDFAVTNLAQAGGSIDDVTTRAESVFRIVADVQNKDKDEKNAANVQN